MNHRPPLRLGAAQDPRLQTVMVPGGEGHHLVTGVARHPNVGVPFPVTITHLLRLGFFTVFDGVVNDADVHRVPGKARTDTHGPHPAALVRLPLLHRGPVTNEGYADLGRQTPRRTAETVG